MQGDTDSAGGDSKGLHDRFMAIVAGLSQGDLTFQPPFDLASSAALACNDDSGELALRMFAVTAARDCGYEVTISARAPGGSDEARREIINTAVASTPLLFALLEGLMEELNARLTGHPVE